LKVTQSFSIFIVGFPEEFMLVLYHEPRKVSTNYEIRIKNSYIRTCS